MHPAAASRSFGRLGRSGTSGAAVSSRLNWRAMPCRYPLAADSVAAQRVAGDADTGEHEAREEPGTCVEVPTSALQACDEEAESTRAGDEPEGGPFGPLAREQRYRY